MDLRLSGFMQGHYPPVLASTKARLSPNGSVIPNSLGEKRGFSWLGRLQASAALGKGLASRQPPGPLLFAHLQAICGNGGFKPCLGTWGRRVIGLAEAFEGSKTGPC